MQLIVRFDAHDRAAFRSAYDAASEERDDAGLTQLQLWEEPSAPSVLWALFGVADRDRAEAWLHRAAALDSHVEGFDSHFLVTT